MMICGARFDKTNKIKKFNEFVDETFESEIELNFGGKAKAEKIIDSGN